MAKVPAIVMKIETDLSTETRFRWLLCEEEQIVLRCPHSYVTRGAAEEDGKIALERRIAELKAKSIK